MNFNKTDYQSLVLQAEIAALLHDIGKFSKEFVKEAIQDKENVNKQEEFISLGDLHTSHFMKECNKMIADELRKILYEPIQKQDATIEKIWLDFPGQDLKVKTLGDLLVFHHSDDDKIKKYFGWNENQSYPLALMLLMIADTLDSSASKSIGGYLDKDRAKRFQQTQNKIYLATPFGEQEKIIEIDNISDASKQFQEKLAEILEGFQTWDMGQIKDRRNKIISLMKNDLSSLLAETRLPNNDVSLWQHSYSTASIFKAMLAWHLLTGQYSVDDKNDLVYHKEHLAYLGIQWNEDEFIGRSYRPKEILGRKYAILKLKETLKAVLETEYCMGNEVYSDRNGIYFLVPSPKYLQEWEQNSDGRNHLSDMLNKIDEQINHHELIKGSLEYRIVAKEVGIQILGLADIIHQNPNNLIEDNLDVITLRTGPKKPLWIEEWQNESNHYNKEICSRCGLRPVEMILVTAAGEADEKKQCGLCTSLSQKGRNLREIKNQPASIQKGVLGIDLGASYTQFRTDELIPKDSENSRLALIQGFFDLRQFMGGNAFSSILSEVPEDHLQPSDIKDRSLLINSWELFLKASEQSWNNVNKKSDTVDAITLNTFKNIFRDSRIGSKGDGRIEGINKYEKMHNYIKNIVLESPFPDGFSDDMKIAMYALRQHPAPSRLSRIWEITEKITSYAVLLCEENKINYFPVSIDPGRFLILVPAEKAWDMLHGMYQEYLKRAARVRHLLPFHLSSSIFYCKAPLYIALDSMRRFTDVQLSNGKPVLWQIKELKLCSNTNQKDYILSMTDHRNREVKWKIPAVIPNGDNDLYYSWFWKGVEQKKGAEIKHDIETKRPFHISELKPEDKIWIHPSTFDFEVLDTTSRRYDIRLNTVKQNTVSQNKQLNHNDADSQSNKTIGSRPHLFCGNKGPRPYPLEEIEKWQNVRDSSIWKNNVKNTQLNRLINMIGGLHQEWSGNKNMKDQEIQELKEIIRAQSLDYLTLCLGKQGKELIDLAVSGALFDLYEWAHLIGK